MIEKILQIKNESPGLIIQAEIIQEDFDNETEELEEIVPETIIFEDNGRTYSLIYGNEKISIVKDLEPKRFLVLSELSNDFNIKGANNKSHFIKSGSCSEEMVIRDHWINSYPQIEETYIFPTIEVSDIPRSLRKRIFGQKEINTDLFQDVQELLENKVLKGKEIEKALQKNILQVILTGYTVGVPTRVLRTLDVNRINRGIDSITNGNDLVIWVDEHFCIDATLEQSIQNKLYCKYLHQKGYKIPYLEKFEYGEYQIVSPHNCLEFAKISEALGNCVGEPQQRHVEDCIDGILQVYLLKKGSKYVACIGVEDNKITECLGRFNKKVNEKDEQGKIWLTKKESKIVNIWANTKGFDIKYY